MAKRQQAAPPDPDLLGRLWQNMVLAGRLLVDGRVSSTAKMIPALVLVYILSPVDFIPDVFLPFGIADDLTALLVGLQLFIHSAPPNVVQEHRQRNKRTEAPASPDDAPGKQTKDAPQIIDGTYRVWEDEES